MNGAAGWAAAWAVSLGLCAGTPALADEEWSTGPPCQPVAGQVAVNGQWQQVSGLACLQPDGSWQLVDSSGGEFYPTPYYYDDSYPWYWAPVAVGYGAFVFVDRHHHVHPMHHVYFRHAGGAGWGGRGMRAMPPGGFRGGTGGAAGRGMGGGGMGGARGGGFHGGGHR